MVGATKGNDVRFNALLYGAVNVSVYRRFLLDSREQCGNRKSP